MLTNMTKSGEGTNSSTVERTLERRRLSESCLGLFTCIGVVWFHQLHPKQQHVRLSTSCPQRTHKSYEHSWGVHLKVKTRNHVSAYF